jgi:hypothetical protein
MKQVIRLTESDLRNLINESVRRIIKEHDYDEWDESDYGDDDAPSDQEVDVLDLYVNSDLAEKYGQETDDEDDLTYNALEENIPTALVNVESSYSEPEMDYYNGTGWGGGYVIDNCYIDDGDAKIIKQLEQNGQIPQGMADELIAAIEEQGQSQAEDY